MGLIPKKQFLSCVLVFLAFGVQAQEKWTLRACIDYAIDHNIEIKQRELTVESSEIDLNTSRNSRLPNLSAGASESLNFGRSQSPSTGIYEQNKSASTNFSVSSSIPVFSGFRIRNGIKSGELNLMAATESLKKAKENLELQVAALYLDVLFKKEILKVFTEQVNLTRVQVERTEILVQSGKVPQSQLYDIRAQLAKDELNAVTAGNDVTLSLLNLTQALNIEHSNGFDIVEPQPGDVIAENLASILPPDYIYRTAVEIKPHVLEAEYRLEGSRADMKTVQGRYWPTVSLSLSYNNGFSHILNSGYINNTIGHQLKNNMREAVGLNINVPIFTRYETRNQVRQARLTTDSRGLDLDNVKLVLFKEIQQAYQSAVASQSKYTSTEKALLATQEAFKYAEERYGVGKATAYELNDAQTRLLSSRSEQLQAKYDFLFRAKILDFYRGIPIDIR